MSTDRWKPHGKTVERVLYKARTVMRFGSRAEACDVDSIGGRGQGKSKEAADKVVETHAVKIGVADHEGERHSRERGLSARHRYPSRVQYTTNKRVATNDYRTLEGNNLFKRTAQILWISLFSFFLPDIFLPRTERDPSRCVTHSGSFT